MKSLALFWITFLSLCFFAGAQTVKMKDRSDWWSILNENSHGPNIKPSDVGFSAGTFEIAKLNLARMKFSDITAALGKTAHIERGDASTARQQACYKSLNDKSPVYLIFEFGEDESSFYLFNTGSDWKGKSYCTASKQVSNEIGTRSGLKLGLTPDQLKRILGQPDAAVGDRLVYSRAVKMTSTPEEFERQRREYPDRLSDKLAHEKFDHYTLSVYVEARFTNSKLSYLAVSKSGD